MGLWEFVASKCLCLCEGLEMKGAKGEPGDAVVNPT